MNFQTWWKENVKDNPLWKITNPSWKDVEIIAKIAWQEGTHQEWEKNLKEKLKRT